MIVIIIKTNNEGSKEYLYIISIVSSQKLIQEKLSVFSSELYCTTKRTIETNVVVHQKCSDPKIFMLWHDRLEHSGSIMMHQIIKNSHGHPLKNQKILLPSDYLCSNYFQSKLITRPSLSKKKLFLNLHLS